MLPLTATVPTALETLPRARGALDVFQPDGDGTVAIGGWVLHPGLSLDRATVLVDGEAVASGPLSRRDDLAGLWPHLPATERSGYFVRGPLPPPRGPVRTIIVVGQSGERNLTIFRAQQRTTTQSPALPVPDGDLLQRVTGNRDPAAYVQIGLDAALDLLRAIDRHRSLKSTRRLLDWGCGPGRVSAPIVGLCPDIDLQGCDLDVEAIAWCNRHLRAGAFHVTRPYPPLPFADSSFDAIVAVSVMSHLDWPVQRRWLAEMRRLLRPGGVFAASVHGPFAAAFFPLEHARLADRGFVADAADRSLRGIAPRGYYRSVFQTPEFTRRRWTESLEVVEYHEAGLAGFQDLVVARRPD